MTGDLNARKGKLFTLHKIKLSLSKKSSTSQITTLLDKSLIEELTGWLTVNNREIVREEVTKEKHPRHESSLR